MFGNLGFGQMSKLIYEMPFILEQLKNIRVSASMGNGAVSIVMNGLEEVVKVEFGPHAGAAMGDGQLARMLREAYNAALKEARCKIKQVIERHTGISIPDVPGIFKG